MTPAGLAAQGRTTVLTPSLYRSLLALLKAVPQTYGWCRTCWSCATLALTLQTKRSITVSADTVRRWLYELDWVWKWAKLVAKDDDPYRVARLARIRWGFEQLTCCEALLFADELDIHTRAQNRLCLDGEGEPAGSHDTRPKSEALSRRGPRSGHGDPAPLPWEGAKPTCCSETC
jgi:hypothetical protein